MMWINALVWIIAMFFSVRFAVYITTLLIAVYKKIPIKATATISGYDLLLSLLFWAIFIFLL